LVGTSCALSPLKGLDLIIQALQELPQTKFCIIGDGKIKNDLIQLSVKLKVSDRVLFLGYKNDAYKYLPYFDAYVIPSHSEGFPLAMLEAAAYGKPIIASNLNVFKEIFTDDEISMFDLNDEKSVPNAIERAFLEKEKLSRNAKLKYENVYSPDNFVGRYLAIYTKLLLE
ncbi:glycosyltransferase family 4 protein, partial [Bacteroides faecis]